MEPRPATPALTVFSVVLVWSEQCNYTCVKILGVVSVGSVRFELVWVWGLFGSCFGGQFLIFFTSLAYGGVMCGIMAIVLWC